MFRRSSSSEPGSFSSTCSTSMSPKRLKIKGWEEFWAWINQANEFNYDLPSRPWGLGVFLWHLFRPVPLPFPLPRNPSSRWSRWMILTVTLRCLEQIDYTFAVFWTRNIWSLEPHSLTVDVHWQTSWTPAKSSALFLSRPSQRIVQTCFSQNLTLENLPELDSYWIQWPDPSFHLWWDKGCDDVAVTIASMDAPYPGWRHAFVWVSLALDNGCYRQKWPSKSTKRSARFPFSNYLYFFCFKVFLLVVESKPSSGWGDLGLGQPFGLTFIANDPPWCPRSLE